MTRNGMLSSYGAPLETVTETEPRSDAGPSTRTRLLALSAAALSLYLSEFRLPYTPIVVASDQWINLHGAVRMAHGERIYADFFQYTWPGTETVSAGLINLFGAPASLFCTVSILIGLAFVALGVRL